MNNLSYMVALAVPPPKRDELAAVQQKFRPVGWKITVGPHVTLIPPGQSLLSLKDACSMFTEVVQDLSQLQLSYPALGVFKRRGLATIFMKPIANDELFELQRRLQIVASSWQDISRSLRRPFVPHITLVNRLPEDQADSIAKQLEYLVPAEIGFSRPKLFSKRSSDKEWFQIF